MDNAPEIGKEYDWSHNGQTTRVIVKRQPLPLMTEFKWAKGGSEPETFPPMAMQCEVEILPQGIRAYARIEDLSAINEPKTCDCCNEKPAKDGMRYCSGCSCSLCDGGGETSTTTDTGKTKRVRCSTCKGSGCAFGKDGDKFTIDVKQ